MARRKIAFQLVRIVVSCETNRTGRCPENTALHIPKWLRPLACGKGLPHLSQNAFHAGAGSRAGDQLKLVGEQSARQPSFLGAVKRGGAAAEGVHSGEN